MSSGNWWVIGTWMAGAILTVLVLWVGHWFPWTRRLTRVQAYVYGTASILLGFSTWRALNGDWVTVAGAWGVAICGGLAVVGAYWIDDLVLRLRQAHKAGRVDDELSISE